MRIAFSNLACPDWSFERCAAAVAEYGYDGLEMRLFDGEVIGPDLSAAARRRVVNALAADNVEVVALDTSLQVLGAPPAQFCSDVQAMAELAAAWGAPLLRLFGGHLPSEPSAREEALDEAARLLDRAARSLVGSGVSLAVETHDAFASARLLAELLARTDGSVGAVYDSHHPHRVGEDPETVLATLGDRIRLVQAKDARPSDDPSGWQLVPLGEGEVPVAVMLAALPRFGYDGWVSLEWEKRWHPELAAPEKALPFQLEWLRAHARQSNG